MKKLGLILLLIFLLIGKVFCQDKNLALNLEYGYSQAEPGTPYRLQFEIENINVFPSSLRDSVVLSFRLSSQNIDSLSARILQVDYLSDNTDCSMRTFKLLKKGFIVESNCAGEIHFPKNKEMISIKLVISFNTKSSQKKPGTLSIEFKLNSTGKYSEVRKMYNPA